MLNDINKTPILSAIHNVVVNRFFFKVFFLKKQ